jgi:hypothetical protein
MHARAPEPTHRRAGGASIRDTSRRLATGACADLVSHARPVPVIGLGPGRPLASRRSGSAGRRCPTPLPPPVARRTGFRHCEHVTVSAAAGDSAAGAHCEHSDDWADLARSAGGDAAGHQPYDRGAEHYDALWQPGAVSGLPTAGRGQRVTAAVGCRRGLAGAAGPDRWGRSW